MHSHSYFSEKRARLISEYIDGNRSAARGKRLIAFSLYTLMLLKITLALFESPTFIILHSPINVLSILLVAPLMLVLYFIHRGAKGFTYVLLVSATLRLIFYFSFILPDLTDCNMTNTYSVILFSVMLAQFFISLFLLVSFDCDTYFSAVQRITIKIHSEERLDRKNEFAEN